MKKIMYPLDLRERNDLEERFIYLIIGYVTIIVYNLKNM